MPGIGMPSKYSWINPPTFQKMPGDYDYMEGASKYEPKDLLKIRENIMDIIDNLGSLVNDANLNFYTGSDLFNLVELWNNLFKINGEGQEIVKGTELVEIGDRADSSYEEMRSTVITYFDDAESAIKSIESALKKLEDNAAKVASAEKNINSDDKSIKSEATKYLNEVSKYGNKYNISTLTNIGKWVY